MLYLKIVKLNPDLQIKDKDMFSKNDMFINITYGEQERRTTIKWNNDQPEWGETFIFPINHNLETIKFELFDADNWSECEVIDQEDVDVSLDKIKEINTRIFVHCGQKGVSFVCLTRITGNRPRLYISPPQEHHFSA